MISLFNAIVENNWNDVFSDNRKKLKLVGVEHLPYVHSTSLLPAELVENSQLPGVTVLDGSIVLVPNARHVYGRGASHIYCIFPNLKEMDMSCLLLLQPYKRCHSQTLSFNHKYHLEKQHT